MCAATVLKISGLAEGACVCSCQAARAAAVKRTPILVAKLRAGWVGGAVLGTLERGLLADAILRAQGNVGALLKDMDTVAAGVEASFKAHKVEIEKLARSYKMMGAEARSLRLCSGCRPNPRRRLPEVERPPPMIQALDEFSASDEGGGFRVKDALAGTRKPDSDSES